ncbi:2-polyprenyl-6-methoxyphenol hydroxylase-like FAD-dependent oxidoreductase [Streptomonospora nanhaiensis]|uniref:2-polyprenyl-6-methoxyphenol hydroxylase-like FAD-dependent oxidoreductase n=1 Tax=Streptomonospora nanhaiensis TaxID=1323731 RepID=A0A853BHH0_9ACTN|nr:FAD-dependent monooxygenase [Streptomonospora nanhaiensis]NYI94928.1 2-polyprenyl-6-methoxyphenol hydroxylase-like FAD-dependent oxidoreductase [Streptomonospora nanhaiensis]
MPANAPIPAPVPAPTAPTAATAATDVVIAGAGPNGLMLACELALAGVRPIVLEQRTEPATDNRANGLVGRVVPLMHRRGLRRRLTGDTEPPVPNDVFVFGALLLDLRLAADNPLHGLPVPQRRIEAMLAERAAELGVEVRRGHAVTGLVQDAEAHPNTGPTPGPTPDPDPDPTAAPDPAAVTVEVAGPAGAYRLRARYLVGADGGHSAVRKLSGIGFPGVTKDNTVTRTAHVSVPAALVDPATGGLDVPGYGPVPPFAHHRTDHGLIAFAPFTPEAPLLSVTEWTDPGAAVGGDPDTPPTLAELRDSVRRVLGADVPLAPPAGPGPHVLRRVLGGNTRLADRFRAGRVLLVGDAAHVHSAMGGPGLNLGLQDAVNLGWKLAAVVRGRSAPGLLDTYEAERRPVAERVNMQTQAQSALIAPGADVTALRELFTELLRLPDVVQHVADTMAGADVRYDMGLADPHPLVGRWAPDLVLEPADGGPAQALDALTRDARPLLLDLTGKGEYAAAAESWGDRVRAVTARPSGATPAPARALLLRPDCHTAWATAAEQPTDRDLGDLRAALERWFGPAH